MFKHLLVPLDGSHLAESSLPLASMLSRTLGATVTLLHVIEKDAPQQVHGDRHLTNEEEACRYLDETAQRYFPPEVEVDTHVHTEEVKDVAGSIVAHTSEFTPDLIVMCAHGRSGLREVVAGSIAQQVIGLGRTPILLTPPPAEERFGEPRFGRLVVPLDGDTAHESCLPLASGLAQYLNASLHLLTVIHTLQTLPGRRAASGWMLPGATRAILDIDEEVGRDYLAALADRLRSRSLRVSMAVRRGDPVQQILAESAGHPDDLVVLGTHGKTGMDAFWAGSVGPKVVFGARTAILLVPVVKI